MTWNFHAVLKLQRSAETPLLEIQQVAERGRELLQQVLTTGPSWCIITCHRGCAFVGQINVMYTRSGDQQIRVVSSHTLKMYSADDVTHEETATVDSFSQDEGRSGWQEFWMYTGYDVKKHPCRTAPYLYTIELVADIPADQVSKLKEFIEGIHNAQRESKLTLKTRAIEINIYLPRFWRNPLGKDDTSWVVESQIYLEPRERHVKTFDRLKDAFAFVYPHLLPPSEAN